MDFWRFVHPESSVIPLDVSYDPVLVILSVIIACIAGFTALLMADRIVAAETPSLKLSWNCLGALVMGCGIWTMHFTGMLAFSVPLPVSYDPLLTLLSLFPAIFGSGAALHFMSSPNITIPRLQVGALLMAVGIGTMHYTGMEALVVEGLRYNFFLFVLSIVLAHIMALLAIYVYFGVRHMSMFPEYIVKIIAAIILGNAVASMHYTAMAAARFYDIPRQTFAGWTFSSADMLVSLVISTFMILGLGIMATLIDRNRLAK